MNITRRNALKGSAAVAAATVLASAPHADASRTTLNGSDARLEELYRAWQAAEADYCRVCDYWGSLIPGDPREPQADAERRAADERTEDALLALAAVPAASLRGALIKLQAWEADGGDERECSQAVRESAFADLRRLAGEAAS